MRTNLLIALALSASTAVPAAGASAVATASARILAPTRLQVEAPASISSNSSIPNALRVTFDKPVAMTVGMRFDDASTGTIDARNTVSRNGAAGELVTTQDLAIVVEERVAVEGNELRLRRAAHVLLTCHTN